MVMQKITLPPRKEKQADGSIKLIPQYRFVGTTPTPPPPVQEPVVGDAETWVSFEVVVRKQGHDAAHLQREATLALMRALHDRMDHEQLTVRVFDFASDTWIAVEFDALADDGHHPGHNTVLQGYDC